MHWQCWRSSGGSNIGRKHRKKPGPWAWVSAGRVSPLHVPLGANPRPACLTCILTTLRPNALRPHYSSQTQTLASSWDRDTEGPWLYPGTLAVGGQDEVCHRVLRESFEPRWWACKRTGHCCSPSSSTLLRKRRAPSGKPAGVFSLEPRGAGPHWVRWSPSAAGNNGIQRLAVTREPSKGRKQSPPLQEWVAACRSRVCGESWTSANFPGHQEETGPPSDSSGGGKEARWWRCEELPTRGCF